MFKRTKPQATQQQTLATLMAATNSMLVQAGAR